MKFFILLNTYTLNDRSGQLKKIKQKIKIPNYFGIRSCSPDSGILKGVFFKRWPMNHSSGSTAVVHGWPNRGHRELLDGRLCRPDSEQRPLVSNFTNVAIAKLCCHNFTQIANFMIFFVSTICYRHIDLSLLKEFSKNVSFWKFHIFH